MAKPYSATALLQSAAAATGNGSVMDVSGSNGVAFQITGAFTATVTFEASLNNSTWVAIPATNVTTQVSATTATAAGVYVANCSGLEHVRARVTWTSGTSVTVFAVTSNGDPDTAISLSGLTVDAEIGAVEIKDGSTDNRAVVNAANTARTTATIVLATQNVDAAGNVIGIDAANTARTTATKVLPTQIIGADGTVALGLPVLTVPVQVIKTVAATATPEALAADATYFHTAMIGGLKAARTNNVGTVYLGIGATNDTQPLAITAGEWITINAPVGQKFDLNDWYLDVLNNGDGVAIIYS